MSSREEPDLSCPVCREVFTDPVSLSCRHSFCRACLGDWEQQESRECPVCHRRSSIDFLLPDFSLKSRCDTFLQERERGAPEDLCRLHGEKLLLFCLDHQEPVCLVCRDSGEHAEHTVTAMDEAAPQQRKNLQELLQPLKEKMKLHEEVRVKFDQTLRHVEVQARHTEAQIKETFKKLHQFLQEEEEARLRALREEEEQKSRRMKEQMEALSREIEALSQTLRDTEEQLKAGDISFLNNYKAAVERVQQRPLLEDPQLPSGALIDQAKHLGNLGFNIWTKMKDLVSYSPVILDPNTGYPDLHVSDDLTSVRRGEKQELPENPERFKLFTVLGHEGFRCGAHSWDVEVGDSSRWSVGVEGLKQSGHWIIRFFNGRYTASCSAQPQTALPVRSLRRIRVSLDYDGGELSFWDLLTDTCIHTFSSSFTELLFPHIRTADECPLHILPKKVTVSLEGHK